VVWAPVLGVFLLVGAVAAYLFIRQQSANAQLEAANRAAAALSGGVVTADCNEAPAQGAPCLQPASSAANAGRGVAAYLVYGPGGQRSRAVFGRDAQGVWQFWYATQGTSYQLSELPGDLRACASGQGIAVRGEPGAQAAIAGSVRDQATLRAEAFVLTEPAAALDRPGWGFYRVSSPRQGWVSSRLVSDLSLGSCELHDQAERGR
jgi:hypothetical protein